MAKFEINDEVVYTFINYYKNPVVFVGRVKDICNYNTFTEYKVHIYSLNLRFILLETALELHAKISREDLLWFMYCVLS